MHDIRVPACIDMKFICHIICKINYFHSFFIVYVIDDPTKFKNIDYLTNGYNLITGNPHTTTEFDPGFGGFKLFDLTYENGDVSADGKHYLPDHVSAKNQPSCSFSFTTSAITNTASYSESLSVEAKVEGEGWGASFSASAGSKSTKETTSSHENRFYSAKADCTVYVAEIDYDHANISDVFKKIVHQLGTNITDQQQLNGYYKLIAQYGTHFVSSVTMGGRYGYRSEMSNSKAMELSSQGINVNVAAGYSGVVSVSASAATDYQKKQAKEFNEARTNVEEFFVGGGPPSDNENWNPHAWATTVAENPLPISYKLIHIEQLLIREHFPKDKQINTKREILKKVMAAYCRQISSEPELCDREYRNTSSFIPLKMVTKFEPSSLLYDFVIWTPILEPHERLPGMLVTRDKMPTNTFVIKTTEFSKLSDVARPAKSWIQHQFVGLFLYAIPVYIPVCPDGFAAISDFYTSSNNDFDLRLPCFANECLVDCALDKSNALDRVYIYKNGFPALGGNYAKAGSSFFSFGFGRGDPVYSKCLSYTCVDF